MNKNNKGKKLVNVNLTDVMGRIVESRVKHYQSDFDIDVKSLREAALKPELTDRTFVWLCRECGTWLLKERNLFIRDSHEYSVFTYYAECTHETICAFVAEITASDGDAVTGNLYAFDYRKYHEHVCRAAVPAGSIILNYERGQRIIPPSAHFGAYPDKELGQFISFEFMPESPEQLEMILTDEKLDRQKFKEAAASGI